MGSCWVGGTGEELLLSSELLSEAELLELLDVELLRIDREGDLANGEDGGEGDLANGEDDGEGDLAGEGLADLSIGPMLLSEL